MKFRDETLTRVVALRLLAFGVMLFLQMFISCGDVSAQEARFPLEKEGLIKALREGALSIKELTDQATARGVAFPMTPAVELEIRREGKYLGKADLDKLISVLRNNYPPPERLRVSLFKYEPCDQKYEVFAAVLSSKVNEIPAMLISKDHRCGYTAGLKLVKEETPFAMSLEEANQYWHKTYSLQLLRGMCSTKGEDVYVISQVFLGDLHGPLGSIVRIEFKVDPEEFANTRDMHTLLLIYSLAKDAQARGLSKDMIIAYLSEALGIAAQIKPAENATLQSVKSAIEALLRELGAADLLVLPK